MVGMQLTTCGRLSASPVETPLVLRPRRHIAPREQTPARLRASNEASTSGSPFFEPRQEAKSQSRQRLFNTIAPIYDELNDRLSFGLHRVWKRMAVKWGAVRPGDTALDVCCGSGDLAFTLADAVGPTGQVYGLDFSSGMLQDAAMRERRLQGAHARMQWVQGDALSLPFEDCTFDAVTMGYGLRNVADIPRALQELRRVLKPGGRVAVLDFNNCSDNTVADTFQSWYLDTLVVPTARAYGVAEEYEYLRPSILKFPTGREQERLAREAGFDRAVHYDIGFGMMGVLVATKQSLPM